MTTYELTFPDPDQCREYSVTVDATVSPYREGDGRPKYEVDVTRVDLDECVAYFGDYGEPVNVGQHRREIEAWIKRHFADLIEELVIEKFESSLDEPRESLARMVWNMGLSMAKLQRLHGRRLP